MNATSLTRTPIAAAVFALATACLPLGAQDPAPDPAEAEAKLAKHQAGSAKLAGDQDELSADVQELIEEQTAENVIELLEEVEEIMAEVTGNLDEAETGGETLAAETEIIEKIFEAAKKRQSGGTSEKSQQSMGAMLEMMQRMMGQQPGDQPGEGQGEKPGDQGGEGQTGESDAANSASGGANEGAKEERRVPKSSGTAGSNLPDEFQKALDAYNAAAKDKEKNAK